MAVPSADRRELLSSEPSQGGAGAGLESSEVRMGRGQAAMGRAGGGLVAGSHSRDWEEDCEGFPRGVLGERGKVDRRAHEPIAEQCAHEELDAWRLELACGEAMREVTEGTAWGRRDAE